MVTLRGTRAGVSPAHSGRSGTGAMKEFFTANIRRLVMLAVFLSAVPLLVILLYSGLERYAEVQADVERRSLLSVQSIADRQMMITENTLVLLSSLRKASSLKSYSPQDDSALFRAILTRYPLFENIFVFLPSGGVVSSGKSFSSTMNIAKSPLFATALQSAGPCALAAASPFSGRHSMQYVVPLTDAHDKIYAYLGAELQLRFFDSIFAGQPIPLDAVVHLINNEGFLTLSSTPAPPVRPGKAMPGLLWDSVRHATAVTGTVAYVNDNGSRRIAAYHRLSITGMVFPYLYVVMDIPESAAKALPLSLVRRDALLLAGSVLFALIAGLLLCYKGFARPVRTLLDMAEKLSRGELGARLAHKESLQGAFADLGDEFNAMAESLEQRSAALEKEREEAVRSSTAKSEFLANMSHEIRTPMNAIIGMTHLVAKTGLPPVQKSQVDKIHAAADDLLLLINNILDFSKIEAGKMQAENIPFHMGRLLNAVRGSASARAREEGIRLVTNIPSDTPPQLTGDPTRLAQALSILLAETMRHCHKHPVELHCLTERLENKRLMLHFFFTVQGVSLDETVVHELGRCLQGHGASVAKLDNRELSLMLAGSILRLLGGSAAITNWEHGFRATGTADLGLPDRYVEDQVLRFDGERTLVLDGNAAARASIVSLLERYNLRVEESAEQEQAVRLLRQADRNDNPFAMVIVEMPPESVDPILYLEKLKHGSGLAHPPLLILSTAQDTTKLSSLLHDSGIDAFLPRPVNESLLVDTLSGLLRARDEQDPGDLAEEQMQHNFNGLQVLLVEDNAVNREIAQEVLRGAGITIFEAKNGQEALQLCKQRPLPYDLVLMDLEMPVMDGMTATRHLREREKLSPWRLPIIAMTAHNGVDEVAACLEAGMNDHTVKPIILSQLFATLRRWQPPNAEERDQAVRILHQIRDIMILSHPRDPQLSPLMESLVPYLHEGRSEALRVALKKQDLDAAITMLNEYLGETHQPSRETNADG